MNKKEIENVLKLESLKRYQYFIKKIADFEQLWTIIDDEDYFATSEVDDYTFISFWSNEEFVMSNLKDGWENCRPFKLTLEYLKNELFDIIEAEDYLIDVFPINGKSGFVVSLEEFKRDLQDELDKIE